MNKIAFIVGNGETRVNVDLTFLQPYGPIFGCNLLCKEYEDFVVPDFTVTMEDYRIEQLRVLNFPKDRILIPKTDDLNEDVRYWASLGHIIAPPQAPRSNAGMLAMKFAIERGFNFLYILGMDFVIEGKESVSNLMDGKPETRCSYDDAKRRVGYFKWFTQQNPNVRFRFVFPDHIDTIRDVLRDNVDFTYYSQLHRDIKNVQENDHRQD